MAILPVVASAADLPDAIRHADEHPEARWYVARRAEAFAQPVPEHWGPIVAGLVRKILGKIAGAWDPSLHPRGSDGRFIEKNGPVNVFSGPGVTTNPQRGTAVGLSADGVQVKMKGSGAVGDVAYADGDIIEVQPSQIRSAPKAAARLSGFVTGESEPLAKPGQKWQGNQAALEIQPDGSAKAQPRFGRPYDVPAERVERMLAAPSNGYRLIRDAPEAEAPGLPGFITGERDGSSNAEAPEPEPVTPDPNIAETRQQEYVEEIISEAVAYQDAARESSGGDDDLDALIQDAETDPSVETANDLRGYLLDNDYADEGDLPPAYEPEVDDAIAVENEAMLTTPVEDAPTTEAPEPAVDPRAERLPISDRNLITPDDLDEFEALEQDLQAQGALDEQPPPVWRAYLDSGRPMKQTALMGATPGEIIAAQRAWNAGDRPEKGQQAIWEAWNASDGGNLSNPAIALRYLAAEPSGVIVPDETPAEDLSVVPDQDLQTAMAEALGDGDMARSVALYEESNRRQDERRGRIEAKRAALTDAMKVVQDGGGMDQYARIMSLGDAPTPEELAQAIAGPDVPDEPQQPETDVVRPADGPDNTRNSDPDAIPTNLQDWSDDEITEALRTRGDQGERGVAIKAEQDRRANPDAFVSDPFDDPEFVARYEAANGGSARIPGDDIDDPEIQSLRDRVRRIESAPMDDDEKRVASSLRGRLDKAIANYAGPAAAPRDSEEVQGTYPGDDVPAATDPDGFVEGNDRSPWVLSSQIQPGQTFIHEDSEYLMGEDGVAERTTPGTGPETLTPTGGFFRKAGFNDPYARTSEPSAPADGAIVPVVDEQASTRVALMLQSANKASSRIDPVTAGQRLADVFSSTSPEQAHERLAALMTELKLSGHQRKRYRALLDQSFGITENPIDSALVQSRTVANGLSDDNPVKARLQARSGGGDPFPANYHRDGVDPATITGHAEDATALEQQGWTRGASGGLRNYTSPDGQSRVAFDREGRVSIFSLQDGTWNRDSRSEPGERYGGPESATPEVTEPGTYADNPVGNYERGDDGVWREVADADLLDAQRRAGEEVAARSADPVQEAVPETETALPLGLSDVDLQAEANRLAVLEKQRTLTTAEADRLVDVNLEQSRRLVADYPQGQAALDQVVRSVQESRRARDAAAANPSSEIPAGPERSDTETPSGDAPVADESPVAGEPVLTSQRKNSRWEGTVDYGALGLTHSAPSRTDADRVNRESLARLEGVPFTPMPEGTDRPVADLTDAELESQYATLRELRTDLRRSNVNAILLNNGPLKRRVTALAEERDARKAQPVDGPEDVPTPDAPAGSPTEAAPDTPAAPAVPIPSTDPIAEQRNLRASRMTADPATMSDEEISFQAEGLRAKGLLRASKKDSDRYLALRRETLRRNSEQVRPDAASEVAPEPVQSAPRSFRASEYDFPGLRLSDTVQPGDKVLQRFNGDGETWEYEPATVVRVDGDNVVIKDANGNTDSREYWHISKDTGYRPDPR